MRCLEKDPTRRPQTADDLVAELDRVSLPQAWGQARARTWWEGHIVGAPELESPAPRQVLSVG
jgi:hypothetical protein